MFDLTSLFSSKAKLKVLRTLFHHSAPLPLRHIAYLSECPVFSIQRALKQLVDEKILTRRAKGHYTLFSLNTRHAYYPFLTQVFELEMKSQIVFSSNNYHQKAKGVLDFSSSAQSLLQKARS